MNCLNIFLDDKGKCEQVTVVKYYYKSDMADSLSSSETIDLLYYYNKFVGKYYVKPGTNTKTKLSAKVLLEIYKSCNNKTKVF